MKLKESEINNMKELMEKNQNLLTEFLKHIVILSSGILAVYVSFMDKVPTNTFFFIITLILLLASILLGTLLLYLQIIQIKRLRKEYAEFLKTKYLKPEDASGELTVSTKYDKLAQFLEYVFVISFLLAICSLVASSIF